MNPARALLLTDVVDSTRMVQSLDEAGAATMWEAHDRAARKLLRHWRGREIDKSDGLLLVFDDAVDAAGYARDYHRALAALKPPMRARAGLHVGPVTLRSNPPEDVALGAKPLEVDGLAKPLAARVMSVASGGQTLLTADAAVALGQAGGELFSHGHWQLAGIDEPVALYALVDPDLPSLPPVDGPKAWRVVQRDGCWVPVREVRHSLPAERDAFVGRAAELQQLARLFRAGTRLVSVLGIGGAGKTRVAIRCGHAGLGEHPGGVWYCDLTQASSIDGIAAAVAQGMGLTLGRGNPVVQIGHALAGRGNALVVLDNFEQVARHAEDTVGRWLERAPHARFLVTTRERLGIVGEQVLDLAPLPTEDACVLFTLRAEASRPGWRAAADDAQAIVTLTRMLDGLPLAIELAAARVRVMSPRTMIGRLNERFDLLRSSGGRRERQATLRAAFDWSWDLLSIPERMALAQLSVFCGGFSMLAAEQVVDLPSGDPRPAVADVLQALVDRSWVRVTREERFDLLESVRDYAAEHLRTEGRFVGSGPQARRQAEARHGQWFAAWAEQHAVEHACAELDNLVAATSRSVLHGNAAVAVRALAGAWRVIERRGPLRLGVELASAMEALPGLEGRLRAEVDFIRGAALSQTGQTEAACPLLRRAADSARALGDGVLEGRALANLAPLKASAGRFDAAWPAFDRALALFRRAGEAGHECGALNALGSLFERQGRLKEARTHYEAGLRLARDAGERRWEGGSAGNLAQCLAGQGRLAEARPLYEQSAAVARALGDRAWEANTRCNLGLLHFTEGRLDDAQVELEASLSAAREIGHAQLQRVVQCNLGLVAEAQGRPEEACAHHEQAVDAARASGDRRDEGQFLGYLGLVHARQGRPSQARACLAAGEAALRSMGDRVSLGILLCARAEAEYRAGSAITAPRALQDAESLARELDELGPDSEFGQALERTRRLLQTAP